MSIRNTVLWHKLGLMYLDLGYMFCNCVVNHIPCWAIRKRLYKFAGMKIGNNARVGIGTIVIKPSGISLGDGCIINEYCHLDGRGGLSIGNNVSVSVYTKIISASHDLNSLDFSYCSHPIILEDYVFIGANAIILENTILKKGTVVGAGAVFKGISEENTIYLGNPIKKRGTRLNHLRYELKHECYFR